MSNDADDWAVHAKLVIKSLENLDEITKEIKQMESQNSKDINDIRLSFAKEVSDIRSYFTKETRDIKEKQSVLSLKLNAVITVMLGIGSFIGIALLNHWVKF